MIYSYEMLEKHYQRAFFACGESALDIYLKEQAGQDVRRYCASVVVAVEQGGNEVLGYYCLSAASVPLSSLPGEVQKRLPRYDTVPAVLLGRLAVASKMQNKGLGGDLLGNAVERACQYGTTWAVFLVSAKHDRAAQFYKQYGFIEFEDDPLLLWIARKQIQKQL